MPDSRRTLGLPDVRAWVDSLAAMGAPGDAVGLEVEWLTFDADDPGGAVPVERTRRAIGGALPSGSAVSFEPGGQLELSSTCWPTLGEACAQIDADASFARDRLLQEGIALVGLGADPVRPARRMIESARYDTMAAVFGLRGSAGARMMCSTASVQVNVAAGVGAERMRRWGLAHDLLPVLAGMFASSPLERGMPTGWMSSRLAAWAAIDPTRTRRACSAGDPEGDWARYLLDADVMAVVASDGEHLAEAPGFTFRRWLEDGHHLGFPTLDDLSYHASTVFPPVRYRGWLELRIADSVPGRGWVAVAALATALLVDAEASAIAERAVVPVRSLDVDARRGGLDHPDLAEAARTCASAALDALPRIGATALVNTAGSYIDRFTNRGRCPADEVIDAWARHGSPVDARRLDFDIGVIAWP